MARNAVPVVRVWLLAMTWQSVSSNEIGPRGLGNRLYQIWYRATWSYLPQTTSGVVGLADGGQTKSKMTPTCQRAVKVLSAYQILASSKTSRAAVTR